MGFYWKINTTIVNPGQFIAPDMGRHAAEKHLRVGLHTHWSRSGYFSRNTINS